MAEEKKLRRSNSLKVVGQVLSRIVLRRPPVSEDSSTSLPVAESKTNGRREKHLRRTTSLHTMPASKATSQLPLKLMSIPVSPTVQLQHPHQSTGRRRQHVLRRATTSSLQSNLSSFRAGNVSARSPIDVNGFADAPTLDDVSSYSVSSSSSTSSSFRRNAMNGLRLTEDGSKQMSLEDENCGSRFTKLRRSLSARIRKSGRNALRRSTSFAVRRQDDEAPFQTKKKKYFTERNKNIFRKLLHPSYQDRNVQYRRLFGSLVSDTDLFLISFSCAYQREILCQGRMYISQRHVCFHANILGWETCFAVPFDEITNITKERAALIFPNSIQFETKSGEKYFFASFVNREKTANALSMVLERREQNQDIAPEEVWERLNPEAKQRSRDSKSGQSSPMSPVDFTTSPPPTPLISSLSGRSASAGNFMTASSRPSSSIGIRTSPDIGSVGATEDVASLSSLEDQEEVICTCENHFGKQLVNTVFPLSALELRQLVFNDSPWVTRFNEVLKNSGYHSSEWAVDKNGQLNRTCTYTMALNHAMAPKSCVVTENQVIENINASDASHGFVVNKETQNSGVPYADHFTVKCTYCVTRINKRECRLVVHGGIIYKRNIWNIVKGYIEKTAYQGLDDHYAILKKMLTEECQIRLKERSNAARARDDASENESLSSSVEDPTTDSPAKDCYIGKSKSSPHRLSNRTASPCREESITSSIAMTGMQSTKLATIPDYGPYIRIIIGLLAGLVFLHILLIIRISWIEPNTGLHEEMSQFIRRMSSPSSFNVLPTASSTDSKMLESLLDTVSQLAADLQKLKQQRDEL